VGAFIGRPRSCSRACERGQFAATGRAARGRRLLPLRYPWRYNGLVSYLVVLTCLRPNLAPVIMLVSSDDGRLYRDDLALNGNIIALCDTRSSKVSFKNSANTTLKNRAFA
jgi:hypothetical protein